MMAKTMTLWPRRTFDFGAMAVGSRLDVQMCDRVPLPAGVWAALALRVYSTDFGGTTSTISVRLINEAPSDRDPELDFAADSDRLVAFVDDDTPTPGLLVLPVGLPFGPSLRAVVRGTRDSSRPITATLSACLVLR